jgi:hypothetical protein
MHALLLNYMLVGWEFPSSKVAGGKGNHTPKEQKPIASFGSVGAAGANTQLQDANTPSSIVWLHDQELCAQELGFFGTGHSWSCFLV